MPAENLSGVFRVRAIRPAFDDVVRLCERTRDRIEIRRHALKLRYWPENHPKDEKSGEVLDLNWSWIKAMPGLKVGELRLEDVIGGNDNLRVIFYQGDRVDGEMPIIWILRVMQKKRDDFSKHDLTLFKARRLLVIERYYKYRVFK